MTSRQLPQVRWSLHCQLVTQGVTHLGDGIPDERVDLGLLQNEDGSPLIAGTSLAGLLREALTLVRTGPRTATPRTGIVCDLFGGAPGDETGEQSRTIVFDAPGLLPETRSALVRDGVSIDPQTGIAKDKAKYDLEVWPAGTTFAARVDLLVDDLKREAQLLAALVAAYEVLDAGWVRLGARTQRGYGRVRIDNAFAVRHDLSDRNGVVGWLTAPDPPELPERAQPTLHAAIEASAEGDLAHDIATRTAQLLDASATQLIEIEAHLAFEHGVLIREAQLSGADVAHLRDGGIDIISGTSLAGVLRQRARQIASYVHPSDGDRFVTVLFGSEPDEDGDEPAVPGRPVSLAHASRVSVDEAVFDGAHRMVISRIRLDAFTQAPSSGALFQEEVAFDGTFRLRLCVLEPNPSSPVDDAAKGLLLLVLKDVLLGDVAVGGTQAVGRGWMGPAPKSRLTCRIDAKTHVAGITVNDGAVLIDADAELRALLDGWVRAFRESSEAVPAVEM